MHHLSVAPDPFADDPFICALRNAGALSPSGARSLAELPPIAGDLLAVFVASGVVRDVGAERYYLVEPKAAGDRRASTPFTPVRVTLMMVVWVVVLLVPLIAWLIKR